MYQFGPYGEKHATAGTFAFKRELIKNKYDNNACLAEEKEFLKNYTVPFVQLDPMKTILVVSHEHNTFDKRKLLDNINHHVVKESDKTVNDFIKEPFLKKFYMNIDTYLKTYNPGRPIMKPDVLEQMITIEEKRRKIAEKKLQENGNNQSITVTENGKEPIILTMEQIVKLIKQQQQQIQQQQQQIQQQQQQIQQQQKQIQQQQQYEEQTK
jgi:hypothetical protein